MTTRTRLISLATLFALACSTAAAAQQQARAKAKPTAKVTRSSQSQAKYLDEQTAPTTTGTNRLITRPADSQMLLPVGTALRVKLADSLSTRDLKTGDSFTGTVTEAVVVNGATIVPQGARLTGRIARVGEPRRIAGKPWIELRPETVTTASGRAIAIAAVVVDTSKPHQYPVSDEGRISGPSYKKTTAMGTGALAGSGALAGALIAGPFGSLVGAGTGATIGTGHYLVTHHSMTIPADLEVIFEISNSAAETASAGQQ